MLKAIATFIFAHIFLFGVNTKVYVAPTLPPASSTPLTTATTTAKISSTTSIKKENSTTTKKTVVKKVGTKKQDIATTTQTKVSPLPEVNADFEKINKITRSTLVNILCTTKGRELSPISGTGVIIGSRGLILTNAHVAQYFLLKDYGQKNFIECVARTGNPAYPRYNLELVYISPTWVENNKTQLKQEKPTGTGENDFAFLHITNTIDGSKLPDVFEYMTMDIRDYIELGEPTLLASYPAGFLGGISILQDLYITSAVATISELFTFKDGNVDLISVPGTVVSQKGSSGGAVVDKYTTLLGIISTSSDGNSTNQRDLRAITLGYINRALEKELGLNLEQFTSQDMSVFAKKFQEINAPSLTKLITDELNKN